MSLKLLKTELAHFIIAGVVKATDRQGKTLEWSNKRIGRGGETIILEAKVLFVDDVEMVSTLGEI